MCLFVFAQGGPIPPSSRAPCPRLIPCTSPHQIHPKTLSFSLILPVFFPPDWLRVQRPQPNQPFSKRTPVIPAFCGGLAHDVHTHAAPPGSAVCASLTFDCVPSVVPSQRAERWPYCRPASSPPSPPTSRRRCTPATSPARWGARRGQGLASDNKASSAVAMLCGGQWSCVHEVKRRLGWPKRLATSLGFPIFRLPFPPDLCHVNPAYRGGTTVWPASVANHPIFFLHHHFF